MNNSLLVVSIGASRGIPGDADFVSKFFEATKYRHCHKLRIRDHGF